MMSSALLIGVVCLAVFSTVQATWNYDTTDTSYGPAHWYETYTHCDEESQSPINIVTHDAHTDHDLHSFHFEHYDSSLTVEVENTGHSAKLHITSDDTLTISGGELPEDFHFEQLHFHWGSVDTQGSEHTINGEHYPLEMHLVHYGDSYINVSDAADHDDGLAVLAFFFEISDDDNHYIDDIIEALDDIQDDGDTHEITEFNIEDLIHDAIGSYYRYHGSLTTPGCQESVIWSVYKHHLYISSTQLAHFRTIHDDNGDDLEDNFRPTQLLHDRDVTYHDEHDGVGANIASLLLTVVMAASAKLLL